MARIFTPKGFKVITLDVVPFGFVAGNSGKFIVKMACKQWGLGVL